MLDLLEKAAEAAHNAWWEQKTAQGFHAPEQCLGPGNRIPCPKCHKDMRPYADLDEPTKELDRAHVRAVHAVYAARIAALELALDCQQPGKDCGRGGEQECARHDDEAADRTIQWTRDRLAEAEKERDEAHTKCVRALDARDRAMAVREDYERERDAVTAAANEAHAEANVREYGLLATLRDADRERDEARAHVALLRGALIDTLGSLHVIHGFAKTFVRWAERPDLRDEGERVVSARNEAHHRIVAALAATPAQAAAELAALRKGNSDLEQMVADNQCEDAQRMRALEARVLAVTADLSTAAETAALHVVLRAGREVVESYRAAFGGADPPAALESAVSVLRDAIAEADKAREETK